jgi:outer membrane protein TolC
MFLAFARAVLRHPRPISILVLLATAVSQAGAADTRPLGLEEALSLGEQRSARLGAQSAALAAAAEQVSRSTELPDPKLRFGVDNLPVSGSDAYSLTRDFMTMRRIGYLQDLPNGEKRRARGDRAERERSVESAEFDAQRAAVRQDIAVAWLDLHYARRASELLDALVRHHELESNTVSAAVGGGKTTPAGALAIRAALESARDRALDQQRNVSRGYAALAALVGEAAQRPLGTPPDTSRLAHSRGELLGALENHPALRVYQERAALADAEVALAASTARPDWNVEVAYGQRSPNFSNMVTVMVGVELPLDRPNRQDRDVATKVNQRERAQLQREEARRMHEAEVRSMLADWEIAGQRVERYETVTLPLARERNGLALAAYRGGRGELAGALEARRAETEAQLGLLGAALERDRAWARLNHLLPHGAQP